MTLLACPRCGSGLHPQSIKDHVVHACGRCAGAWLDLVAGRRLTEAVDPALATLPTTTAGGAGVDTTAAIACPICQCPLHRYAASNSRIELDHCTQHGTWFDGGELQRLAHALAIERAYGASHAVGVGVAAVGAAALAQSPTVQQSRSGGLALDTAEIAADVVLEAGGIELGAAAVEGAGVIVEAAAEAAPAILESVFELMGGIFEGLG